MTNSNGDPTNDRPVGNEDQGFPSLPIEETSDNQSLQITGNVTDQSVVHNQETSSENDSSTNSTITATEPIDMARQKIQLTNDEINVDNIIRDRKVSDSKTTNTKDNKISQDVDDDAKNKINHDTDITGPPPAKRQRMSNGYN